MDDQITTATKPTNGAEKATSGGFQHTLETMKSERHVWLMKCPLIVSHSLQQKQLDPNVPHSLAQKQSDPNVSHSLAHKQSDQNVSHSLTQKQPESSTPLDSSSPPIGAKVIVTVDPLLPNNGFSSTQFTMELLDTESEIVPKRYSMDMSTDFIPMSVFSESKQGKVSVEGKIYHKFDMKPHSENMEEYGKLCRERTNKYMTKIRQIQVIVNDKDAHMRPMPGSNASRPPSQTEKKKGLVKGSDSKRTRRDRREMEDIMFKLFERQSNWTLKNLISETNQPEQFLKDLLKDLCIYNNKGSYQGTYELKPEYKRSTEEQEQEMASK